MLYLRKIFKLPSPKELGWSKDNALEMREFSDEPKGKTWEDWYEYVKQQYPTKYFLAETLPKFVKYKLWFPIRVPIDKVWYWIVSHIVPSRRYHMLDLRQEGGYRYGWQDVPDKMLYAVFNLLGEYLNEEGPHDLTEWYSKEQIEADPNMKRQQDQLDEARSLYQWWIVGRKEEQSAISNMLNKWHEAHQTKNQKKEKYWDELKKLENDLEEKTDLMLMRILKIRQSLWT